MCENEYDDKEKKISEKKEELRTLRKEIIENDYEEMKMISIMEKQLYERKQMSQFDDWEIITILYEKENMIEELKSRRQEFLYSLEEYINDAIKELERH